MHEELIKSLNESGLKKSKIEFDLGMPLNSLSGMLSGSKEIPVKWIQPLTDYMEKLKVGSLPETYLATQKGGLKESYSDNKIMESMNKINKDFGAGTIMFLGDRTSGKVDVISTGSLQLDFALGIGGLPRGRIIEIFGLESSGKTTIAMHVIKNAQKKGLRCLLIDAENAFDPEYAANIGINIEKLSYCQPSCGEEGLEVADRQIASGEANVIVIDSVAALIPKSELEGQMGDSKMGLHARLMSQACRKMSASISKTNSLAIFINQIRNKIGIAWGNPEVTTGGLALQFYASVRLSVRRAAIIKDGELQIGNKVVVKVVKNKCAPPFKNAEFDIIYGEGIDKTGEIIDMASELGIIHKAGSWFYYNEAKLGQGREQVRQILKDNPSMSKEIEDKISVKICKTEET